MVEQRADYWMLPLPGSCLQPPSDLGATSVEQWGAGQRSRVMDNLWSPWRLPYILNARQEGCFLCEAVQSDQDRANLVLLRGRLAFLVLNRYPYNNGHLMAVPYQHAAGLELLGPDELDDLMAMTTLAVRALRQAMRPEGFNIGYNIGKVAGAGLQDHVHCHIVPRWTGDTNFMPVLGQTRVLPQSLESAYDQIKLALGVLANNEDRGA
jgi:ATP adenylyltransferase